MTEFEQRALWTFVDVDSPVLNVWQDVVRLGVKTPDVGCTYDFGAEPGNTMHGTWQILSVERPWKDGKPDAENVRVNVKRVA